MKTWYVYILEIKYRIILIFVTWISTVTICYFHKNVLLYLFVFFSNHYSNFYSFKSYFIFTEVTELFSIYFDIIFFVSNQILYFSIFYHSIIFLSFGLYKYEYKNLTFIFKILLLFWIFFVIFFNYVILPLIWNFFLSFQMELNSISLVFEAKLKEYVDFYIKIFHLCFLNFQFLIFIFLFFDLFIHNLEIIKNFRRLYYFIFIIFSTFLTPPDVFSQLAVSFLLIFFYELFIFLKVWKIINMEAN